MTSSALAFGDDRSSESVVERYAESPHMTFARRVMEFALALAFTTLRATQLALAPALALMPSFVTRYAKKAAFAIGYGVYLGPLGRWLHKRMIAASAKEPHSRAAAATACGTCVVVSVPFMNDNYSYLIVDGGTRTCAVIDPADPERVSAAVDKLKVDVTHVLTTHRHHDHAGGNAEFVKTMSAGGRGKEIKVYGHKKDGCHGANASAEDGAVIRVGETRILVKHVPCHTLGHVVYAVLDSAAPEGEETLAHAKAMFTGDAIINCGVGAFFHGDSSDCYENLNTRLADTPDACLVFSGHEYMEMNLRFAKLLDSSDEITANAFYAILLHRHREDSTMPSSFRVERRLNPFFRCRDRAYLKILLEKKLWMIERKTRPWWHRFFGAQGSKLQKQRAAEIERHPLSRLIRENETKHGAATREEVIKGIDLVQDLMMDSFAVGADIKKGDDEEHSNFMLYARAMTASGPVRVIPSELVAEP